MMETNEAPKKESKIALAERANILKTFITGLILKQNQTMDMKLFCVAIYYGCFEKHSS